MRRTGDSPWDLFESEFTADWFDEIDLDRFIRSGIRNLKTVSKKYNQFSWIVKFEY